MKTSPIATAAPRRRRWLLRIGVLSCALLAAVFLADRILTGANLFGVNYPAETLRYRTELCELRLHRPDGTPDLDGVLFMHRPGAYARFHDFAVAVNGAGFRGPEIAVPKPPGTYRILALGDSVAFGWGVDDEHTYLRRLERDLNAQLDDRRYEVVNTGHPMYDSVQELAMLREHGLALEPDLVLLTFVVNDIEPSRDLAEALLAMQAGGAPQPTLGERVRQRLAAWLPGVHSLAEYLTQSVPAAYRDPAAAAAFRPEETESGARGWQRAQRALLEMRDLCRKRGIPFVVLDHSFPPVQSLPPFCDDQEIPRYDLRFTADEQRLPIFNSARDPHANALGHELLLAKVKEALRAAGLFELR